MVADCGSWLHKFQSSLTYSMKRSIADGKENANFTARFDVSTAKKQQMEEGYYIHFGMKEKQQFMLLALYNDICAAGASFGFIEDVITKKIDYHLFEVEVEFHRSGLRVFHRAMMKVTLLMLQRNQATRKMVLKKASHNVSKEIGRGASGIVYKGVLVDNEVLAIKRLEEFSNNQGEAKLIAADISTLGRLNHMNLIEFWGTKVVPSEVVVDKDDETLMLVFDEALGVGDGVLEIKFTGVTFKIPVGNVPSELTALSNMPVSEETIDRDFKTVSFEESPLMSTYLVAVMVGLFDYIKETTFDGIKVRAYCLVGKSEKGKLALSILVKSIELYTKYFSMPYILPKIDMVAVPDFLGGAMENYRLITYREAELLHDDLHSAQQTRKE
ncbi:aminopeptidase M1-like protein isoform X1 [Tanacetum coccineum]